MSAKVNQRLWDFHVEHFLCGEERGGVKVEGDMRLEGLTVSLFCSTCRASIVETVTPEEVTARWSEEDVRRFKDDPDEWERRMLESMRETFAGDVMKAKPGDQRH